MSIKPTSLIPRPIYPMRPSPFRFVAACDMPVNPVAWLIKDYIEEDALAVMYGPPGKGKSFIALDMSCCIASNLSFHGHNVKAGAVFYIAGEGHNGLARRLRAWAELNNTDMPRALFVSEAPADLASEANATKVMEAVQQLADASGKTPVLIVIDTLARNFGGDENSATDMGNFIRNADALRRLWKATVLIVHHSGKDSDRGARGSSALKGAADAEYEVGRNDADQIIRLTPRKMKDAEEPASLAFELVSVPVLDDSGVLVGGAALRVAEYTAHAPVTAKLGKQQKAALDVLEQMHAETAAQLDSQGLEEQSVEILLEDWRSRCLEAGMPRQRFHDARETLTERGQIRVDGVHVSIVRPLPPLLEKPMRTDKLSNTNNGQNGQLSDDKRTDASQASQQPEYEDF